ncbi:RNA polymerase sigma factor [Ideonella sp.]|uniref:RNA polymerase sigma factor n=1 Tax=Ideonella sp. TaxID=1929293 RepID=UPI002B45BF0A|nr:sigma-70 family RNA polymerase sigma factor [Ideonella sp.]HJV71023.1 sigma-70 family RNA polymerase sigma factor [Ideonella sp.]
MFNPFRRTPPPDAPATPDQAWIRRIAETQDRAALAALYREYQPRLVRFLGRLTRHDSLIEEVVNDTLWIVWQKAGDYRGEARVSTWIMGIAYRVALKAFRDQDDPCWRADESDMEALLVTDPRADRETHDWLAKGLARLPPDQRLTVELVYGQGHTLEETAAIMECPIGTAKARLFHARVRLRNVLPDLAGEPEAARAEGGKE